ncbi:MAG: DUF4157 domain-containing protein [Ginsengibacter sp.]
MISSHAYGHEGFFFKPFVQPKLTINQPNDIYEREADAVAEKVMRMPANETKPAFFKPISLPITPIQRKCAACEDEEKLQRKEDEDEEQHIQLKSSKDLDIHRKCDHCEVEEKLQMKGESSAIDGVAAPPIVHDVINSVGQPLDRAARNFMESRLGYDFGNVQIHNDSLAHQSSKQINALAYTHSNHIVFGGGQYLPHTSAGKQLLAHELTHVVQQKNMQWRIQKDDSEEETPNTEVKAEYDPENVIALFLNKLAEDAVTDDPDADVDAGIDVDSDADVKADDDTDSIFGSDTEANPEMDDATGWLGTGTQALRKKLLVEIELMKLGNNSSYRQSVIDKFFVVNDNGEELYLKDVKTNINTISKGEGETLNSMDQSIKWEAKLDENSFIDNWFIIDQNAADAFPESAWKIVFPLVAPPGYMFDYLNNGFYQNQKNYFADSGIVSQDMSYNGLPVSYVPSLSLSSYSLVKNPLVSKLSTMPTREWIYHTFILPEEDKLHTEVMKQFTRDFVPYVSFNFQSDVYNKWVEASKFRWIHFDTLSISTFRQQYPTGLHNIEQFYSFNYKGVGSGLGIKLVGASKGINTVGTSPFLVLSLLSEASHKVAPENLNKVIGKAYADFQVSLTNAGDRIAHLSPNLRLMDAIEWSITKGFAEESITALLENLDTILLNILEEFIKDKAVKKAIMTGVGLLGPWGRAISLIYNIWEFFDDAKDKIELALLIKSFIDILDEARAADSVIKLQQSAAKLAQAYETTFQILIQKLGGKLLGKLSAAAAKKFKDKSKSKGKLPQAQRAKLLDDTYQQDDARAMDPIHLKAEVETALESPTVRSHERDYDRAVTIGNSHTWKRIRGTNTWCRSSAKCTIGHLDPELESELNKKADTEVPKGPADTEEMGQQLTDDLGLSPPVTRQTINVSQSVADAIGGGFVSKTGEPLKVDMTVQFHRDASDVRQATDQTGKDFQSAHHVPSSVGNKLPDSAGYSRRGAVTVLLPPATHRAFDDYWKRESIKLRQAGVSTVTVAAFREIMDEAIAQTPGITNKARGAMRMVITTEFRDLGLNDTDVVELPYSNIR